MEEKKMPERTPFERAVDRAFAYHPFRLPDVQVVDKWVVGPTFMVKGDYTCPLDGNPHSIWKVDGMLRLKVVGMLSGADEATEVVTIASAGHPKQAETHIDKYGAERPTTPTKCTCRAILNESGEPVAEVGFPLLSLGKKVAVEVWRFAAGVLYGFNKDGDLVAVIAAKGFDKCLPLEPK